MPPRYLSAASLTLLVLLVSASCGSGPATAPTGTMGPPVTPTTPLADLAGTWTGTVESDNAPARQVTLVVVQALSCVDGEWKDATGDWRGAISGFAAEDSFSGQISFERSANGGGKCQAAGTVAGPVVGDTFRWTADPLTANGTCDGGVPQHLVLSVRRQR